MPIKIFSREAAKAAKRRVLNSIHLRVFAPSRETIFSRIIHFIINPNVTVHWRRTRQGEVYSATAGWANFRMPSEDLAFSRDPHNPASTG
jgi:hypothetical protein